MPFATGRPALKQALLTLMICAAAPAAWAQKPGPVKVASAVGLPAGATPSSPTVQVANPGSLGPCQQLSMAPAVPVSVGKSAVIKPAGPVARILLGNPEGSQAARPVETSLKDGDGGKATPADNKGRPGVAELDVLLLSPTELYLLGKSVGTTNVVLLDRTGQCTAFDVVVGMDTAALQSVLSQLLPEEKDIRIIPAFDSIVLTGSLSDAGAISTVMDIANAYVRGSGSGASVAGANPRIVNMLSTGAPQQVMLEVKVAEVSKALIDKLGAQFSGSKTNGNWTYTLLANLLSNGGGLATAIKAGGALSVAIDGQRDDNLVKVLAEPTIMAISGKEGHFNAGGKIFIPVAQKSDTGGAAITLEEKEFGVSVRFKPTVMDAGRINLEMVTEVSELNREGVGIRAAGISGIAVLPAFTSRKASTTVQLKDGQSFAVGGLIKNTATTSIKAFPVLGELPVLGALFRSTEFQSDKSELVFVITPRLVKPLPPTYALPTDNHVSPTRSQLMLGGKLEGRAPPEDASEDTSSAPATPDIGFQVK